MCRTGGPRCTSEGRRRLGAALLHLAYVEADSLDENRLDKARKRLAEAQHEYDLTKGGLADIQAQIDAATDEAVRSDLQVRYDTALGERERLLAQHRKATEITLGRSDWATPDVLDCLEEIRGHQGHDLEERWLLDSTVILPDSDQGTGVNETRHYDLSNGETAWHKPFSGVNQTIAEYQYDQLAVLQPIHEAAAWRLANALGEPYRALVPPCVLREVDDQMGSLALHVEGRVVTYADDVSNFPHWKDAAFFDALIGQQDRHGGNVRYDFYSGELHLIDQGFTFARTGDGYNDSIFVEARAGDALSGEERALLRRLVDSSDLLGLRGCLTSERADAVESRARRMLGTGVIPGVGEY